MISVVSLLLRLMPIETDSTPDGQSYEKGLTRSAASMR